jgi:hypothetical protein
MDPDGPSDAPEACTTATAFGGEITSAVGGTGVAMVLNRFNAGTELDVAVAVTTDTLILHGDSAGNFVAGQALTQPAIALASDDFDLIGSRKDLIMITATDVTVRQQSEAGGGAGTFLAAQSVGTFTSAANVFVGEFGGTLVADIVIQEDGGNRTFTSAGAAGTFSEEDTVGAAGDKLVFVGQIDKANDEDIVMVDAAGNVKLALSDGTDGSFAAPTMVASGATGLGVSLGNFDDDAFLDIVVATAAGGEIYLQNSASPGVFTKQTGTFGGIMGNRLLVGDVNDDGLDDVVTPTTITMQCPTTHVFTQVESIDASGGAVLADLNANGKLDLLRLSGTDLVVRLQ